ncbi:MAG TPA: type II toxin-antitoxin system HipA family toxin [Treponemataceae bacterium]|nr:type II toxin-antitoxin system HipA family toxin [Treponemataceae bacterium]
MKKSDSLDILMNGTSVGVWRRLSGNVHEFTYEESWLTRPECRPVSLSLPLDTPGRTITGDVVERYFDNLLPDNADIRRRMQRRFGCTSTSSFDLLSETGRDCVGALQIVPTGTEVPPVQDIQAKPLDEHDVASLLGTVSSIPSMGTIPDDSFRISIAGAQEKTALLFHEGRWHIPLGSTPTTHILKLPLGYISAGRVDMTHSVHNEWLCLQILDAFGLETAQTEILTFDDVEVLAVERFDRRRSSDGSWWIRLPQEDFCQALGRSGAAKYENEGGPGIADIMQVLLSSGNAEKDRRNFLKAQILFFLLAAPDGHAKNFSIFLEREGRFHLTPIYDVMSVYPVLGHGRGTIPPEKLRMAMAVTGANRHYDWVKITGRHWMETARRTGSEELAASVLDEILDSVETVIDTVSAHIPAGFPESLAKCIFEGIRSCAVRLAML